MPEPRTHYQVSFTSRQAILFFVVVLAALTGAYFLGVVTGLAGRPPSESGPLSASAAAPTPAAADGVSGAPAAGTPPAAAAAAEQERTAPPAAAAREPGKGDALVFFEDRPAEPTPAPRPTSGRAPSPAKSSGSFWVQVLSTTSESEAKSRRALLAGHGYRVLVETTHGPKGPALYRVRVGPYRSREEASKAAEALQRREKATTWIVSPGE